MFFWWVGSAAGHEKKQEHTQYKNLNFLSIKNCFAAIVTATKKPWTNFESDLKLIL